MATVNYYARGRKSFVNIYCRLTHTRSIDLFVKTNVLIPKDSWDQKRQKIKSSSNIKNKNNINKGLAELSIHLFESLNDCYMGGDVIDKYWLEKQIAKFFNRPKNEKKIKNPRHTIYYVDFANWWLNEKSSTWLTSAKTYMNPRTKSQYASFLELFIRFQEKTDCDYKILEINNDLINKFIKYMDEESYAEKTIHRHKNRLKFFCSRAKGLGYRTDPSFEERVFIPKTQDKPLEPILDVTEIEKIYNLELKGDLENKLGDSRDNLIIACWTGLRVSDYLNKLDISNFIDDFIEIKTTKTNKKVVIPVHKMVKKILIKRNGRLPKKVSDSVFNKQIKDICRLAGIDKEMRGGVYVSSKKRKVYGLYKKYELVSSHIGRRSFATNHFGKLPNSVIMSVCGWAKEEMFLEYVKKTNRDSAVAMKRYWDENYQTI